MVVVGGGGVAEMDGDGRERGNGGVCDYSSPGLCLDPILRLESRRTCGPVLGPLLLAIRACVRKDGRNNAPNWASGCPQD